MCVEKVDKRDCFQQSSSWNVPTWQIDAVQAVQEAGATPRLRFLVRGMIVAPFQESSLFPQPALVAVVAYGKGILLAMHWFLFSCWPMVVEIARVLRHS
jgi:hypothetical protein